MKKKNLLIGGIISILIVSCGQQSGKAEADEQPIEQQIMALSEKDTTQVVALVNQFMTAVKEERYTDAAGMLYGLKANDSFATPELLDNDQLKGVLKRLKYFPVYDFSISGYTFKEAFDNEVRCTVALHPKTNQNDTGPNTTWYFKPVRYLGEWKLCFKDSSQGDRTFKISN